jgi:glycolate oxidase FAD binding subunit
MLETLQAEWQAAGVASSLLTPERGSEILEVADFTADVRIAVRPSQVVELMIALRERYPDSNVQSHAGNGIVLVESSWGSAEGPSYYRQIRELADMFGGKMTVLSYPDGTELSQDDIWGPPGEGFTVMQSLKDRFDPQNILNPGRFIFE